MAKSADFRKRIDGDVAVLEKSFAESEASLVDLDIRGDKVLINRQVVRCNSQQIRVQDVTGVRFGIFVQYTNGVKSSSYLVGIAGHGTDITIECKRFLRSEEQAQSDYKSILNGLFHHVLPKLAARIAKRIAAGSPYEMGGTKIAKEGIYLRTGMLMWEKEHLVSWKDVRFGIYQGSLCIRSGAEKALSATMDVRNVFNAVIFEPIVKTLMNLLSDEK